MEHATEKSYGIIPLRRSNEGWLVLLIKHQAGHWSFPKGHPEEGELPIDSANRELFEETGLRVSKALDISPFFEKYHFQKKGTLIDKTVTYFLAEVEGKVLLQDEELADFRWVPLSEASDHVTFPEAKRLCHEVFKVL